MAMYMERALFVVAPRNYGKSTILRSMLRDKRFGLPREAWQTQKKLPDDYSLGNDRRLYVRLTSPHEMDEDLEEFLRKSKAKMSNGRWCFAGPLHPGAFRSMPDARSTLETFIREFEPERVRVMLPWPSHRTGLKDEDFGEAAVSSLLTAVQGVDERIEAHCIDTRSRDRNGFVLSDFFDFT